MVAWPEVHDGKGGVKFGLLVLLAGEPSGVKFGSPTVFGYTCYSAEVDPRIKQIW